MKYNIKIAPEKRKDKDGIFIRENVPIFVDTRFAGGRLAYFSGYRINTDKFDSEPDGKEIPHATGDGKEGNKIVKAKIINKRLEGINTRIKTYFEDNPKEVSKKELKTILDMFCGKIINETSRKDDNSFFTMFMMYIEDHVSPSSRRNVKTVYNNWQQYEKKRRITLTFEFVTVDILRDFQKYLKNESTKPLGGNLNKNVKAPKGANTIHRFMKTTRAFWNFARKELKRKGILIGYPFGDGYNLPGEIYGKPIYISIEERNKLFEANLKTERLKHIRDIFVFQCFIGARVGDLCKLTKSNLQNNALTYVPRKTKDGKPIAVTIPLHPMAIEILSRYNIPDGSLLPFISHQRYNEYIRELFETSGLTRIVTRLNPRTKEEEHVRLCDIASSQMARRAFVGNLYGKVDNGIISSMSGHVPGSKAFTRYYDVSSELQQEAINKL